MTLRRPARLDGGPDVAQQLQPAGPQVGVVVQSGQAGPEAGLVLGRLRRQRLEPRRGDGPLGQAGPQAPRIGLEEDSAPLRGDEHFRETALAVVPKGTDAILQTGLDAKPLEPGGELLLRLVWLEEGSPHQLQHQGTADLEADRGRSGELAEGGVGTWHSQMTISLNPLLSMDFWSRLTTRHGNAVVQIRKGTQNASLDVGADGQ